MRSATLLALVFGLAACTERDASPPAAPPASEPPPQTVAYACEADTPAEASYSADGALALTVGDETWPMYPAEAVSGARWVGETMEWWVTLEGGQEVGTLSRLGPQRVGETVVARCIRPTTGGVLAPEPPGNQPEEDAATAVDRPCQASAMSLDVISTEGAAGSRYTILALENAGTGTCALVGYPGLSLVGQDGRVRTNIRVNQDPGSYYPQGLPIEPVELAAGGRAYFDLVSTAVAGEIAGETEPCAPIVAVRVSPAGDAAGTVQAPLSLNPCNGRVRVTPFRPVQDPNSGG